MDIQHFIQHRQAKVVLIVFLCLIGILMRFYNITEDTFIYYDEGLYLNYNRAFVEIAINYYPYNFSNLLKLVKYWFKFALPSGKALWFLVIDMRLFWGGLTDWFYPRIVSAIMGSITLFLTFLFAKRFFSSQRVGYLSLVFLALLPSHVFYSRLALQEAFCTFFFLSGFYLYLFPGKTNVRTFLSGACFAAAFFSNYRLIIIPLLVLFTEGYMSFCEQTKFNIRRYIWCTLTFFVFVFGVGGLDGGNNTYMVFAWMFHQAHMSGGHFDFLNFLSYPYYIFRLEGLFFGFLFFGNIYYIVRKNWNYLFPFLLPCLLMFLFSFPMEKGMRYIAISIPLIAMAAASLVVCLFERYQSRRIRVTLGFCVFATITTFLFKSYTITQIKTDYKTSLEYIEKIDPRGKILSTQHLVQNLYTDRKKTEECPRRFHDLMRLYVNSGYRYLVVGPRAYADFTEDELRFSKKLVGYLDFAEKRIKPIKIFPHFDKVTLERFVFEHSQNLRRSIAFLNTPDNDYGILRVYKIKDVIDIVGLRLRSLEAAKNK